MKATATALLLSVISLVVYAQTPVKTAHLAIKEKSLGKLLPGADPYSLTTDAAFRRVAYVVKRGGKELAVVDGVEGKEYDAVAEKNEMYFSPDGKRLAYVAKRGDKKLVVVDRIEGKEYDDISDLFNPVFSPNSKQVAFIATTRNKLLEKFGLWSLKDFVVVNGAEGKAYENVEGITFSPDSRKLVYFAQPHWNRSGCAVVNGVEGKHYDYAAFASFSPDSSRLAYVADRRIHGEHSQQLAVLDGKEGSEYGSISGIVFSPDSKHSAYLVRTGGNWLIRDGVAEEGHGLFQEHGVPVFSPDSKHLAYVVSDAIIVDGKVFDDQQVREYTHRLVFSPDSQHLAYVTRFDSPTNTGYDFAVLDGVVQKESKDIFSSPYFSPDGKRLVYLIRPDQKEIPVYGEFRGNEYDRFATCDPDLNTKGMLGNLSVPFSLDGDGTLHAIVLRDGEIFRLELKVVEE